MIEHFSKLLGLSEKHNNQQDLSLEIKDISVDQIIANPYQPRDRFDDVKIKELAKSISSHGVIQPIIIRSSGELYEIVAGERRWRAVKSLGLSTIPAIIREFTDNETATIALIENLQREELSAIEEAKAYQQLILLHSVTQEVLAEQLGISQSTIANKIRLLQLSEPVKQAIQDKSISERHARTLLKIPDQAEQLIILQELIAKDYSVKQLETRIHFLLEEKNIKKSIRKISYTKDVRLALNTVRQSVEMIKVNGIQIESVEQDHSDFIEINLRIYKQK